LDLGRQHLSPDVVLASLHTGVTAFHAVLGS
jgi:hypothetical protein